MSKYKEVYNDIKEKITNGTFKAREFLKSESDLAHKYSYSKDTIRKALSMLELDGYIQKIKGKNSMVLENGRFKNSLSNLRTSKELNKIENIDIHTNLIEMEVVSGIKEIMDVFEVSDDVSFYKVSRTRVLDGEALEYEITYLDKRVVPFLDKKIVESSIYDYLEKKYMDLKNFDSVVVIESHTYLSNGTLFQYGINSYRPDKFEFSTVAKR
ncbi:UTRA domain-containing protein [Leptotrichia sp. HMT-225]|uniref:UTRA domain-containing protein n=1 Tax=Leptotrichia sp. HMT-225 TaxID=3058373 RepID=UPI00272C80FD|nr:UTRA domain-containing protein [Leptotrichia sp. HMT-225]WLD73616.1 UTRA domain-containing protein [Leptotrichia sp. HMT-225]